MTRELSEIARVSRSPNHLSADMGDLIVLMSVKQGKYVGLDKIGTAIWQRLEQPITVADLCADLHASFVADEAELKRDVIKFLNELRQYGIIEVV